MLSKDREALIETLLDTITGDDEIDSLLLSAVNALMHCGEREDKLMKLEVHGVDNWQGYDIAMSCGNVYGA